MASNQNINELTLKIALQTAEFNKNIKEVNSKLDSLNNNASNKMKMFSTAFSKVLPILGSVTGGLALLKKAYTSTEGGADNFAKKVEGGKNALHQFMLKAGNADFSNLISEFKKSWKEGEHLADVLDQLGELTSWSNVTISRKENASASAWEKVVSTKDVEQRKKFKTEYLNIEKEIFEGKSKLIKKTYEAEKEKWAITNGYTKEGVNYAISVYQTYNDMLLNNAAELAKYERFIDSIKKGNGPIEMGTGAGEVAVGKTYNKQLAQAIWEYKKTFSGFAAGAPEELAKIVNTYFGQMINAQNQYNTALKKTKELIDDISDIKYPSLVEELKPVTYKDLLGMDEKPIEVIVPDIKPEIFSHWDELGKRMKETFSSASLLEGAFYGIGDAFTTMFSEGKGALKEMITVVLEGVRTVINAYLAEAIAATIAKNAKLPFGLIAAGVGVAALTAFWKAKVPAFASGTNYAPGGLSLVGERGPELVNLPRGSQVYTASQTRNMFNGGEVLIRFENGSLEGYLNHKTRIKKSYR